MADIEIGPRRLKAAVIKGMVEGMVDLVAKQEQIDEYEIPAGLRGEGLTQVGCTHARTHSNGAKEALKAQQH